MNTEIRSLWSLPSDRFEYVFERIRNQIGKLVTNLVSSSTPMTNTDKIGLIITIIAFSIVITPIALSDSDPYHLKWIFEEIRGQVPLIENFFGNQGSSQYTVIIHLKSSPEFHLDTTEKVILGKFRSITN